MMFDYKTWDSWDSLLEQTYKAIQRTFLDDFPECDLDLNERYIKQRLDRVINMATTGLTDFLWVLYGMASVDMDVKSFMEAFCECCPEVITLFKLKPTCDELNPDLNPVVRFSFHP